MVLVEQTTREEGDGVPAMPLGIPQSFGPSGLEETRSPEGVGRGPNMVPLFDQEQLNRLHALQQQAAWMYSTRMATEVAGEVARPSSLALEGRAQVPEQYDIFSHQ